MKYLIPLVFTILLLAVPAFADSNLYIEIVKQINGSWKAGLPILEVEIAKTPLLIDWESRLNYTMPRGGSAWNHHSIASEFHVGAEWPLTYKGKSPTSWLYATGSIGGIFYIQGNDDSIPSGLELSNTFRAGIKNKF